MKKILLAISIINILCIIIIIALHAFFSIKGVTLSEYFFYSGCFMVCIGVISYLGGGGGFHFQSDHVTNHELEMYKLEEKNMIRDMENGKGYQKEKFVGFMTLCSIPSFLICLIMHYSEL